MKASIRILAFIMALMMVICSFVACNGDDNKIKDDTNVPDTLKEETNGNESNSDSATDKPKHVHVEVSIPAKDATCTETGLTEGKRCSECNEIIVAQEIIAKKPHTEASLPAKDSTCSETGLTEGKYCSVCNEPIIEQVITDKKEHTEVIIEATDSTCKDTGLTEGKYCSVCNEVLVEQTVINKKPHTDTTIAATPSTCKTTGLTEGKYCSVCNEVIVKQEIIPVKPHAVVIDPAVPATFDSTGLTEGTHCSECGDILVTQVEIPKLIPQEYSITYMNLKGAASPTLRSYKENVGVALLPEVSATGYRFVGWFTSNDGGEQVSMIEKGSQKNYVLYARWEKITYTVQYINGEGHGNVSGYTVEDGTIVLKNPTASKNGYTFAGWFTAEIGGNKVTFIDASQAKNLVLYAQWTPVRYNINYYNGTGHNNPTSYTVEDSTIRLNYPANKVGYTFAGWFTESGEKVEYILTNACKEYNLTAKFNPIKYEIQYENSTEHSNPVEYTVESSVIVLKNPTGIKQGYNFKGWFTSATSGSKITSIDTSKAVNVVLYAQWTPASYIITYKNGTGHNNPTSYTVETNTIVLKDAAAKIGYNFEGWYNNSNEKVTEIKKGTTGDITLTAKWSLIEYKITYDLGNADNSPNNRATYNIETPTFTLASPTLSGYHFVGWLDDSGALVKQINKGTTGHIHLTPKWSGTTASIVPYAQIDSPIYNQVEKKFTSDNKIVYIYYMGYIANVPTGTANESNIIDYNGTGEYALSITESNSTTSSTTTYGKTINSTTTNWENGLAEKIEIKAESKAMGGIVTGSVSGSLEMHQSWGQNIAKTHESGQDIVTGEINETTKTQTYTLSPDKNPVGYYWYSIKATVDVFALIEYDPITQKITYDSARVWRDLYSTGWTYAASIDEVKTANVTADYGDFCFEVPDEFFEDIDKLAGGSAGLIPQENGTECKIVGYTGTDKDVLIPMYLNGRKVTAIDSNLFQGNTTITSVNFGAGVTSIPNSAFKGCTALKYVVFNGELTNIGTSAFYGCSNLKFTIPNTVTNIGASAFYGCKSLSSATISANTTSIGETVFKNCGELSLTVYNDNLELIQIAINSGATNISINYTYSESEIDANKFVLTVPEIKSFKFNGNSNTFKNLYIVSDAVTTTIEYTTINNTTAKSEGTSTAIILSSITVNLRAVTVSSVESALELNAATTNLNIGGTVTLTANNGNDGLKAANLNIASNSNEAATLTVTGGTGTKGGKGSTPAKDGTGSGGTGGVGGNGGIGISATSINVSNYITMSVYGGSGGNGGTGGNSVNKYWGSENAGGKGGNGGAGNLAIDTTTLTIDSTCKVSVYGGNGGNGGNGGYRDTRYGNGSLGSGGSKGEGSVAIADTTTVNGLLYSIQNGEAGSNGSNGGSWHSQDDYSNGAYWG